MAQQKIELRQIRDFGQNISDTFQYIRQEFTPLLKSFLGIAGVFILLGSVTASFYQDEMMNNIQSVLQRVRLREQYSVNEIFSPMYFLTILFSIIGVIAMKVVAACYFKLYEANNNSSPTVQDVWKEFTKYMLPITLYTIILMVLCAVGMLFCVLPGVYLLIVFTPIEMIFVVENVSFSQAFNRSFQIIRNNFWTSFGIYLVSAIIYSVASGIVGLLIGVVAGLVSYFSTNDLDSAVNTVTGVLNVISQLFYIIFLVSVGLHYYNLVEQNDGEGLLRKINTIGNTPTQSEAEEQY